MYVEDYTRTNYQQFMIVLYSIIQHRHQDNIVSNKCTNTICSNGDVYLSEQLFQTRMAIRYITDCI